MRQLHFHSPFVFVFQSLPTSLLLIVCGETSASGCETSRGGLRVKRVSGEGRMDQ